MLRGAASMPYERPAAAATAAVRSLTLRSALKCPRSSTQPGPKPCKDPEGGNCRGRASVAGQGSGVAAVHSCDGDAPVADASSGIGRAEAAVTPRIAEEAECSVAAPPSCFGGDRNSPPSAGSTYGGAGTAAKRIGAAQTEPTPAMAECGVTPPRSCFHSVSAAHAGAGGGEAAAKRGEARGAEPGAYGGCGSGMKRCSSGGSVQAPRRAVASGRT